MTSEHVHTHSLYIFKDTHTHKHTVRGGNKSEEMLMPTNTLGRSCVALNWSLSHTHTYGPITAALAGPIKLFSKCCSTDIACLVNPACYWQKCSSITQACVVALLWSHLDGDHSLCIGWLGLVICEEGLVMLCLLESGPQLSWLLRFRDFCSEVFLSELLSTDTARVQHETWKEDSTTIAQ